MEHRFGLYQNKTRIFYITENKINIDIYIILKIICHHLRVSNLNDTYMNILFAVTIFTKKTVADHSHRLLVETYWENTHY